MRNRNKSSAPILTNIVCCVLADKCKFLINSNFIKIDYSESTLILNTSLLEHGLDISIYMTSKAISLLLANQTMWRLKLKTNIKTYFPGKGL